MRNVDQHTITQAFLDYCSEETDPRLRVILERLAHHLHAFTREVELTHDEWRKAIEFLTGVQEKSPRRSATSTSFFPTCSASPPWST